MQGKGSDLFYIKIVTVAKIKAQPEYVSVRLVLYVCVFKSKLYIFIKS